MDIVKVSWSGGKDSTCAVIKHLEKGDKVVAVCYIPMFDDVIPLISKSHYEFILRSSHVFNEKGVETYIVSGITYLEYCTHVSKRGKYKGLMFCFPGFNRGQCGFKRDSKLKALRSIDENFYYDYEDVGIAFDEVDRHGQLNDLKRSILVEQKITEKEALKICENNNLLSPIYLDGSRDGCVLCPNAKRKERIQWLSDYPDARAILESLQKRCLQEKPWSFPLRNYKMFIDEMENIN